MSSREYPNPSMEKRSSGLKSFVLQALVILLILGVAWFFMEGPLARHKILGNLTVTDTNPGHPSLMMLSSDLCRARGENDDINESTVIVVRDGNAVELATGTLGRGVPIDADSCEFGFVIEVPKAEIYRFSIAGRGTVTYTREQLSKNEWNAGFVIGEEQTP